MRSRTANRVLATALACTIGVFGLAMTGCNSDSDNNAQPADQAATADEQDNCYGDDLPVINTGAADEQDNCYGDDLPVINN